MDIRRQETNLPEQLTIIGDVIITVPDHPLDALKLEFPYPLKRPVLHLPALRFPISVSIAPKGKPSRPFHKMIRRSP